MNESIRPRSRGGFTLVEMLIVIAIIGILAAGLVVAVSGILDRTKMKKADAAIKTLLNALENYKADFERYPPIFSETAAQSIEIVPGSSNESTVFGGGYTYNVGAGFTGTAADARMRRNRTLRLFLELKWRGKNNSPYISLSDDVDRAVFGTSLIPIYVDPWGQPYVINCPGKNHAYDKDDTGAYISGRTDLLPQGRETNYRYEIYSFGSDNVDSYNYTSHDNAPPRTDGTDYTHGDDVVSWGRN